MASEQKYRDHGDFIVFISENTPFIKAEHRKITIYTNTR